MASGGPEDQIESKVVFDAEAAGWLARKVSWPGRRAAMDHVFVKAGRTVWIEFKKDRKTDPDELQKREHDRFRAAGAEVYVVGSIADGRRILGLS